MKKSEMVEIIRGIIQEDLSEFIKPIIQKTILEELSLVLMPAVKKVMKEQIGQQNIVRENMLPVSDYRKKLLQDIGLAHEPATLMGAGAGARPRYDQPKVGPGLNGILSETLNDMKPGEMEELGVGQDFNSNMNFDLSGGNNDYDYNPPVDNFMNVNQVATNTNSAISKLDESLNKNYSEFLDQVSSISERTRGAKSMEVNMHQDAVRSRITTPPPAQQGPEVK